MPQHRENVTCTVNPTQRTEAQRTTPVFIIERFPLEVSTTPPLIERIRNRGYVTKSDIDVRERIVNRAITGSDEPLTPTKRRRIIEENRRLRDRPRTITPRINPLRNQQRHRTAKWSNTNKSFNFLEMFWAVHNHNVLSMFFFWLCTTHCDGLARSFNLRIFDLPSKSVRSEFATGSARLYCFLLWKRTKNCLPHHTHPLTYIHALLAMGAWNGIEWNSLLALT